MQDLNYEDILLELECAIVRKMNEGVPGPYLEPKYADLEAAILAKIAEDRSKRSSGR